VLDELLVDKCAAQVEFKARRSRRREASSAGAVEVENVFELVVVVDVKGYVLRRCV
jgi:hypothetical protein